MMSGISQNSCHVFAFFFFSFSDPCHSSSKLRRASSAGLPSGWDRGAGIFTQKQFGVSFQQKCVGLLCAGNVLHTSAYIFIGLIADSSAHPDIRNHDCTFLWIGGHLCYCFTD